MEAPLGVTFFKKVELYQKIVALDRQLKKIESDPEDVKPPSTWNIERKVLAWSYTGHRHLGSPLHVYDFKPENPLRLKEFDLVPRDTKHLNLTKILENFVAHGFATHSRDGQMTSHDHNVIYLTKEGLLVGEILKEIEKPLSKFSYFVWSGLWGHIGAWMLLLYATIVFYRTVVKPLVDVLDLPMFFKC